MGFGIHDYCVLLQIVHENGIGLTVFTSDYYSKNLIYPYFFFVFDLTAPLFP